VIRAALLSLGLLAGSLAEANPVAEAQIAARDLEMAAQLLASARTAEDRIAALTLTIRAYEQGMSALRAGLRQAAVRARVIEQRLEADEARIAALLGALQAIEKVPGPVLLLHPSGPEGSARAGMMMADIAPGLQAEVESLRADVQDLSLIRATRAAAVAQAETGLADLQTARVDLAAAMAARTGRVPVRTDPAVLEALLSTSATLGAFAAGLSGILEPSADPGFEARRGFLPRPVAGSLLYGFNDADQAGVVRPGWVLATEPGALVTTPAAATVRYAGPLLDYGNVIVLEPQSDYLLILAGLETLFGRTGDILVPGDPVGLMGDSNGTETGIDGGQTRRETLYLELRQGTAPADPANWFETEE